MTTRGSQRSRCVHISSVGRFAGWMSAIAFVALAPVGRPIALGDVDPIGPERDFEVVDSPQSADWTAARRPGGDFVVVWTDRRMSESHYYIRARRFDADWNPLGPSFIVNEQTTTPQGSPEIAAAADNTFLITWTGWYSGAGASRLDVFARRFVANGTPDGSAFRVNSYTTTDQSHSVVAAGDDGRFIVAWHSYDGDHPERGQDGDRSGVFARLLAGDGSPAGTEFQLNETTHLYQDFPRVAALEGGGFVVAWSSGYFDAYAYGYGYQTQDGDDFGVVARRLDRDARPLGTEFVVNTYTSGPQHPRTITAMPGGRFVVGWTDAPLYESQDRGHDGDLSGVFAQRFDARGSRLGTEIQINSYTTGSQFDARVARIAEGGFVVVWSSSNPDIFQDNPDQDGDLSGVFGQQLDSIGRRVGTEFQIHTYTTGSQYGARLFREPGGDLVALWRTSATHVEATGWVTRRFSATIPGCDSDTPALRLEDALLALRAAVSLGSPDDCPLERCDYICDEIVTVIDALAILRHVVQPCLIPEGCPKPCCG